MNYVRSLRANYNNSIAKELSQLIATHAEKHKNVLDVGCGTGDITTPLAEALPASAVTGCDLSEKAITDAKLGSFTVKNVSYGIENISKLPEDWTKKYDVVLMFDVLHDLQHPEAAIKQVLKVLAADGIVIIVDPKVSSDPLKNVGNIQAAQALTLSSWWCIPSSSCDHGSGLGVGWGWENKEEFLTKAGLVIKSRVCIINSDYNYAYVCKRKLGSYGSRAVHGSGAVDRSRAERKEPIH
ncbi:uncharacterized protein LOC110446184 [Mizuhopecten yessoensis]|uniref:Malonyl-[acyl-carrier protein] O-methyltransferase n=1 Tax=Mizuhopecten yessoensis TaxID=6573 RepID=A0A210R684_MIZYE|nr:uncharacterized protein LOC110446184 [Mizuhopecten yessoensis]OWF56559.1 Malonyl-[acyl-carrier protein] O-methyltransferase [Mizuhopecten yessoensis]